MKCKSRAGGTWTEARYWGFIRSTLRRAWLKWPVRGQVLRCNRRSVKGKRHRFEYQCEICNKWHKGRDVEVDHIIPCGKLGSYQDLPGFVERLFCEVDNLRVLCKPCHKKVTEKERAKKK